MLRAAGHVGPAKKERKRDKRLLLYASLNFHEIKLFIFECKVYNYVISLIVG